MPTQRAGSTQRSRYLIRKVEISRITLRDIGAKCGLSAAGVSLALRNHRSIPETTRERVRNAATALGYRPDPALAALNHYRRRRTFTAPGYVLAYVTCFEKRNGWQQMAFFRRAFHGAPEKADSLGYRMSMPGSVSRVSRRYGFPKCSRVAVSAAW